MIPALYQDFALEYAGVVDAVSSPVHKSKAARRPVAELLHLHLWFSELMNHVADDVPSATEQNGCASNPKHRNVASLQCPLLADIHFPQGSQSCILA